MVVILSAFTKIHCKLTLSLYCTPVTCFLREYVGGSEKNLLITGADVRTGDLLPSRMRVAVMSTGQRFRTMQEYTRNYSKVRVYQWWRRLHWDNGKTAPTRTCIMSIVR